MEVPWQRIRGMLPWRYGWVIIISSLINSLINSSLSNFFLVFLRFSFLSLMRLPSTSDCFDVLTHLYLKQFSSALRDNERLLISEVQQREAFHQNIATVFSSRSTLAHTGNHLTAGSFLCSYYPTYTPARSLIPANYSLNCGHIFYSINKLQRFSSVSFSTREPSCVKTSQRPQRKMSKPLPHTSLYNQSSTGEIWWFPVSQDLMCILPLLQLELFMSAAYLAPQQAQDTLPSKQRAHAIRRKQYILIVHKLISRMGPLRLFIHAVSWKNHFLAVR